MKEELKNILFMGLGAISLTGDAASKLKEELLTKGQSLYNEGMIKNEELKRNIKQTIKDSVTVEVSPTTKEDLLNSINNMSKEEREEIIKMLQPEDKKNTKKDTKTTKKD